jgi:hypothetical protein
MTSLFLPSYIVMILGRALVVVILMLIIDQLLGI